MRPARSSTAKSLKAEIKLLDAKRALAVSREDEAAVVRYDRRRIRLRKEYELELVRSVRRASMAASDGPSPSVKLRDSTGSLTSDDMNVDAPAKTSFRSSQQQTRITGFFEDDF